MRKETIKPETKSESLDSEKYGKVKYTGITSTPPPPYDKIDLEPFRQVSPFTGEVFEMRWFVKED